jgi:hypothetical protein
LPNALTLSFLSKIITVIYPQQAMLTYTSALAAGENQLFLFASRCHESGSSLSQQIQTQKETTSNAVIIITAAGCYS